jgi:hypothetical protein
MSSNKLYSQKLKEYFLSQNYTDEEAETISKAPHVTCEKFVQLEQVKKMDELIKVLNKPQSN